MNSRRRSLAVAAVIVVAVGSATAWWRMGAPYEVGEEVATLAQPGDIFMYSATTCGWCKRAARWFAFHDIPYRSCEIDLDPQCKADFYANRGIGTPLMVVRGQRHHGYSPERIVRALRPEPSAQAPADRQAAGDPL
jgi:glutaredoxin